MHKSKQRVICNAKYARMDIKLEIKLDKNIYTSLQRGERESHYLNLCVFNAVKCKFNLFPTQWTAGSKAAPHASILCV